MEKPILKVTREKHLDHLVKVIPLIFLGYCLQAYLFNQVNKSSELNNLLLYLGLGLASMILTFVAYDSYHKVEFFDDHLKVSFLPFFPIKTIHYAQITAVDCLDEDQSFGCIKLKINHKKSATFYFIDNAGSIKKWIQQKIEPLSLEEAA